MKINYSRRAFAGLFGGFVAAGVIGSHAGAQDATPSADDLFAAIDLQPGVVPTILGDVEVPETVERIVTLTDGALDSVTAIGVTPVGLTASSNFETIAAYLEGKVVGDFSYVGGWGELDLEAIVALEPDIILTDRYQAEETIPLLQAIAPVVATGEFEVAGPDVLQQWEREHLIWSHALGRLDDGKHTILALRDRAHLLQTDLGDRVGESVVVFRPQSNFPVIMSHAWITGVILTRAGLRGNELTESTPPPHTGNSVSLERLDLLEADWLFAATRNEEMVQALADYLENPSFQTLTAVQNDQVARVAGDLWSGATGVLAGHAMLDDVARILVDGDYEA